MIISSEMFFAYHLKTFRYIKVEIPSSYRVIKAAFKSNDYLKRNVFRYHFKKFSHHKTPDSTLISRNNKKITSSKIIYDFKRKRWTKLHIHDKINFASCFPSAFARSAPLASFGIKYV